MSQNNMLLEFYQKIPFERLSQMRIGLIEEGLVGCWGLTLYQQLWSYHGGSKFGNSLVFDDRIYEMVGETCHRDHYPTPFERWQGVFYVQCPIDRAPHTIAFDNSVMVYN